MECVSPISSIAIEIGKCAFAPVRQWLCYSFNYKSNIQHLKNEEKNLQDAKTRVQRSVDDALGSNIGGHVIEDDVKAWLTEVNKITELATRILCEETEVERRSSHATCLSLKHRHQLSREANKIAGNIVKHLEKEKFTRFTRKKQDHLETTKNKNYVTLDSRTLVLKEIMELLGDSNINKIGVWGLPGVGKSTLMNEIERRAKEEKLFLEVFRIDVNKSPELNEIKGQIAILDEHLRRQTEIERSNLQQESSAKKSKMLVILDDIWKGLDLEDIGIPSEGCKVVLTSRHRDVLRDEMDIKKILKLESLPEEEAWNLFEKMAGDCVKDSDVRKVAIKVAERCAGLPVALTTVAKALKGKTRLGAWRNAELQLKRRPRVYVPDKLSHDVYRCIELSYDHLPDEEHKSLFLLCALLGRNFCYRDLLRYGFGLGLFQDNIITLEEARDRLSSLVCDLQDSCLLLESSDSFQKFYYMHDVIHDIGTIIASSENRNMFVMGDDGCQKALADVDSLKRCEALSILGGDIDQLPNEMECPKLRFFHVDLNDRSLNIPDSLFKGLDNLNVLDLKKMELGSLPSSLLLPRNLQTLCLHHCVLEDISRIGELKNLVILSLGHSKISELPKEVGSLDRLRMLDLSNCSKLQMIPPNVLSSLGKLEELYMGNSFVQWESEVMINNERKNASLAELNDLPHLTALEIQIPDTNNAPADLSLKKLKRFIIFIGDIGNWQHVSDHTSRTLKVKFSPSFQPQFWVKSLWNGAEDLHLYELHGVENIIPEINSEGFEKLKNLLIQNSAQLKYILGSTASVIAFPKLETFVLENMISLKGICYGELPSTPFKTLRVLKVINCEKLTYVFSSSIVGGLPSLEELKLRNCKNMFAIVVKERHGLACGDEISFPRLQTLALAEIPKLVSFMSTKTSFMRDGGEIISVGNHDPDMPLLHDQVALPNLKKLRLRDLPKINHIWSTKDSRIPFMIQNLQVVKVRGCESLKSLFPVSIVSRLEQLKEIFVVDCGMEEIVAAEGRGEATVARSLVFPRVTSLFLKGLRRLKRFYEGMHISKWPMLEWLWIDGCENVEILVSGLQSFQETVEERRPDHISRIKQPLFLVDELSFPSLKTLNIRGMKKLEIIWQDQVAISSFSNIQNLQQIEVDGCESLRSIFPSSVISCLKQLKRLWINNCGVEEIVSSVEGQGGKAIARFVFPQLTDLSLKRLDRLKWFYKGVHVSKWPKLKEMWIEKCNEVEILFASGVVRFQEAVEERRSEMSIKQPLFLVDNDEVVAFPSLEILHIDGLPKIRHVWTECSETNFTFQNLKDVCVYGCWSLKSIFPTSVISCLQQLERLRIDRCGVKEIVAVEGGGGGEAVATLLFPRVTNLELSNLRRLKWFYKGVHVSKWPMLKCMKIYGCEQIEKLVSGIPVSFEETVGENIKQPLFLVDELSFPSLENLEIERMEKLKIIWQDQVATSSFSNIQKLKICTCKKLETIFGKLEGPESRTKERVVIVDGGTRHLVSTVARPNFEKWESKDPNTIFRFQNLQEIEVYGCHSLRCIFPTSAITCLKQLKRLEIKDCGMEEIVAVEGEGGEAVARFVFPQVTKLSLERLDRLKWFYKGVHVSKWPMLEEMWITKCYKVEIIASGVESFQETVGEKGSEMPIKQPLFLVDHDQLSFPRLKNLEIERMEKLEIIWQDQVATSSFSSIQTLKIDSCKKLETIFGKLEGPNGNETPLALIAPESRTKERVVIVDGGTRHLVSTVASPSLQKQDDLPKQIHSRSEDPNTIFRFQNLQDIEVSGCESLRSVFTSSVISCLKQLRRLGIKNCAVEEIVSVEGEGKEAIAKFVFPQLTKLSLKGLHRLKWFYKGVHVSKWPKLEVMRITECDEVEILFASGVVRFQEAVEERRSEMSIKQPLFLVDNDELSFPSLKTLYINYMDKLKIICQDQVAEMSLISNLQMLRIFGCQRMPIFQNRQSFETILGKHEGQNGKETQALQSTFPNLLFLSLDFNNKAIWSSKFSDFPPSFLARMPNLLALEVYDSGWEEIFPNELLDREIQVLILPRLRGLALNRLPMLTHLWKEDTQPCPLFHNMEFLEVSECAKLRNLVPSSVFLQNLTDLSISNCHGLINLVTSSTARSLTQLKEMSVTECKRITEIIAMEDGEANHLAITFNKLEYLELEGLPNLTNFCSGPYSFNFPSLKGVFVISCPEMKTFCQYGVLTTPQLTKVKGPTYYSDQHWKHDLNTTTHWLWELDHYDTRWLFRQSVENTEEDEDP